MQGSGKIPFPDKNCGIHSISVNKDYSKLATGALNPNSIGFYRLPTLEPICLGEVSVLIIVFSSFRFFKIKLYYTLKMLEIQRAEEIKQYLQCCEPVSYTHLTLPTIYSV